MHVTVCDRFTDSMAMMFPQDQRQTEAIQLLQAQLTNMTQLASNLSATVAELKREVITVHRK